VTLTLCGPGPNLETSQKKEKSRMKQTNNLAGHLIHKKKEKNVNGLTFHCNDVLPF